MYCIRGENQAACNQNWNRFDWGPEPFIADIPKAAEKNEAFRAAQWTGCHLQMVLMCIPAGECIGWEMHEDVDQMLRVEEGQAMARFGSCEDMVDYQQPVRKGDVFFVPACTWHDVVNMGECALKLSTVYGPSKHPRGTIHKTKADAAAAE